MSLPEAVGCISPPEPLLLLPENSLAGASDLSFGTVAPTSTGAALASVLSVSLLQGQDALVGWAGWQWAQAVFLHRHGGCIQKFTAC